MRWRRPNRRDGRADSAILLTGDNDDLVKLETRLPPDLRALAAAIITSTEASLGAPLPAN